MSHGPYVAGFAPPQEWVQGATKPLLREDVQLMNRMRKAALTLAAALLSVVALGITAPAHAMDTNWPCPGCVMAGHR
jgi:hypothetical protein